MLLLVIGFHGLQFSLSKSFIHGSGSILQVLTAGNPHVTVCCCPGKFNEMAPTLDLLLQRINSAILETQLISHDSAMMGTELFTHLHMLGLCSVLESAGVDLPQRDKDRLMVKSIGGNDLFGLHAHKFMEWKKDPATESAMLIATAMNEQAKANRKLSCPASSSSRPLRSTAQQSPLDAISAPKSRDF